MNYPKSDSLSRRCAGFTVVELSVVIGIIVLLAALLLPAIGRSRDSAAAAACATNLRQIGGACFAYAVDNDGLLPFANDNSRPWPAGTFMSELNPYLGNLPLGNFEQNKRAVFDKPFRCPGKKDWSLAGPTDLHRVSYALNTFNTGGISAERKKLSAIDTPAKTLLAADIQTGSWILRNTSYMYMHFKALRHGNRDNVVFCDGHVESIPKDGLTYDLVLKP